jgi:hypothetical protein
LDINRKVVEKQQQNLLVIRLVGRVMATGSIQAVSHCQLVDMHLEHLVAQPTVQGSFPFYYMVYD